ncbi:DUF2786 domain-containing protein [Bradyrhizobium sp. PMVTL-01]|uniref:DUF2786 domain-containing protein n=1 Tax=unclassified Bradyrhizobium TaxID=2631580 RepID=UPI003F71CF43
MIGRELAKARIKKLRKMTTGAGCTLEEAASAAAKIAELMTKYGMDEGDLSLLYRQRTAEEAGMAVQRGRIVGIWIAVGVWLRRLAGP